MHLFLNGLAASAGAGLTYIRNVVPRLSETPDTHTTVALSPSLRQEFADPPNISFLEVEPEGAARRFWREQTELPQLIKNSGAEVLISAGNFALRKSPIPQILLSGNSLYTSIDFYRDLRNRHEYRMWLDTRIRGYFARRSIYWADCTVAPSEAFAADLRRWTGSDHVICIYHGFDSQAFAHGENPLPANVSQALDPDDSAVRILFVSHYTHYRNFETLLRATAMLRERFRGRKVKLFLTCRFRPGENPGSYRTENASDLVRELGIGSEVFELGGIPYYSLHHLYKACDIYVTAAYAETFAHPLVEAMSSGLPVIASDLPVHREICKDAALYFERFSPEELADRIIEIVSSPQLSARLAQAGETRRLDFSWEKHVGQMVKLASNLVQEGCSGSARR